MSIYNKIFKGSIWLTISTFGGKLIQTISAILLTRIILPKEYGYVTIALAIMGIAEQTTSLFFETALVQKEGEIKEYLDTTFVLNIVRYVGLYLIIYFLAPYLAIYFNEVALTGIIRWSSTTLLFMGFRNTGTVYFRKNLEFKNQFYMDFIPLMVNIGISLLFGYKLKSAWAFIYAGVASGIAGLILSYALHTYRPTLKFSFSKFKELFKYGRWILVKSFAVMIKTNGFSIFLGKIFSVITLGYYNRGNAFSFNIFNLFTNLMWQIFFPAYCSMNNNKDKLKMIFLRTFRLSLFVLFPLHLSLFYFSKSIVIIFLTSRWLPIVPIMQYLTTLSILQIMNMLPNMMLDAIGKPKINSHLSFFEIGIIGVIIYPLTKYLGITGAIASMCIGQIITMFWFFKFILKYLEIKYSTIINYVIYLVINNLIMVFIFAVFSYLFSDTNLLSIILSVLAGGVSYLISGIFLDRYFTAGINYELRTALKSLSINIKPLLNESN